MNSSLYEGNLIRLAPLDHEKDPTVVAGWTQDPRVWPLLGDVARPLPAQAVRKLLEKIEKRMDETKNFFNFALRLRQDNRLVGLARIDWIDFHSGTGFVNLAVGDPTDRRHGYGSDALALLLRFAFDELNLHRLSAWTDSDNLPFLKMVEKFGFEQEALRREASFRAGRYWDVLMFGILRPDWEKKR